MKILIFLSLCVTLALGCSNLPELAACNRQDGSPDCSCQAGLSCVLTKKLIIQQSEVTVKQCMPEGMEIEVETVDHDEQQAADSPMTRRKRFLFNGLFKRCAHDTDCGENQCCLLNKRCAPKLPKYFTCYLTHLHKCGCADGLVCTETASFTVPFTGIKIPLRQCI
ncbi:uncharacterized protein LOC110039677 isoform X2 [Orbicella faveolata]|uniref:uncharacterized protein LOC110039677 isoform X1 n=1 Tax=Orbicella faveolata TaxID=48498 RepID=UPI0009E22BCC|nr:uncharacterized protein LOC110039677 isoform X1 [Orbicella faveolata]XP_020600473.1 uncharacterized protein LOC110039677 isoform X2 [Orbicella faveolata]